MTAKKPDDETLPGAPDFSARTVAPEVSQGAWRERVFAARAVMSADEVVKGLETGLRDVLLSANHTMVAFQQVRSAWLPFLRQAIEQHAGDGVDAWLLSVLKPKDAPRALDPLFDELVAGLVRVRQARDLAQLEEAALKCIELIRRVFGHQAPRPLSFKQMEKELEGKLDVDELFVIAASDVDELSRRLSEVGKALEALRVQVKATVGSQPTGIFANFVRLKAEARVVDGELKRRTSP